MANFPNIHRDLANDELHTPKDLDTAPNSSGIVKTIKGDYEWRLLCWECPILDFVDAEAAPPTTASGDRYIIYAQTASTVDVEWGDAVVNDLVEYDIDTTKYNSGTPHEGLTLYDKSRDGYWKYDGTHWQGYGFTFKAYIYSAQVLTLNSLPIELAAAPLAGYALKCTEFSAQIIYNSVAYATNTTMLVKNSTATASTIAESQFVESALLPLVADGMAMGHSAASGSKQIIKEDSLAVTVLTGDPTAGDSDITVYGTYDIIKL